MSERAELRRLATEALAAERNAAAPINWDGALNGPRDGARRELFAAIDRAEAAVEAVERVEAVCVDLDGELFIARELAAMRSPDADAIRANAAVKTRTLERIREALAGRGDGEAEG